MDYSSDMMRNGSGTTRGVGHDTAATTAGTRNNLLDSVADDDEAMEDFMSEELRMMIKEAEATLENEQQDVHALTADSAPALDPETPIYDTSTHQMVEDTEDRRLKEDLLGRYQARTGDDDIMSAFASPQEEQRQPGDSQQKSVSFIATTPKPVQPPQPQQIMERRLPTSSTPARKSSTIPQSPRTPLPAPGKTPTQTPKAKSWSMSKLYKKTVSTPSTPKPAAETPLPPSPAYQKPAAMTPLPPSPMDQTVKMASAKGGPVAPALQDASPQKPLVASFGSKNSSFRRAGRKVAPLPPSSSSKSSPSPRKSLAKSPKSPGLPAYMQPTDSYSTRKAEASPQRQRPGASPLKQRPGRAGASPLRRRADSSPQRQHSSPSRRLPSPSSKGKGSPIKTPPPKILSRTPPSASLVANKPRPRVVTASPEKPVQKVLPPSAEQPKPAKSALRSGESKSSFYDRLAQPRKQVVIRSPQKDKVVNEKDPTTLTPPAMDVPKRMPTAGTPRGQKKPPTNLSETKALTVETDMTPEKTDGHGDNGKERDSVETMPNQTDESTKGVPTEDEAKTSPTQVVKQEGGKKVVVVQSKLAKYIGGKSPVSGSRRKKKASLAPSTPGDNVTPRSSHRQKSVFDRSTATPRRLETQKTSGSTNDKSDATEVSPSKARPKPETPTSLPVETLKEAAVSPPDRKEEGPPKPETLVAQNEDELNGLPPSAPSALKLAVDEAAVPSPADSDLLMALAADDDDDDDDNDASLPPSAAPSSNSVPAIVRPKQRSSRGSFMKSTSSSATRRQTASTTKSSFSDAKEAATKARERVLQKKKLEAEKMARRSKQKQEEAAKASAKRYPKSGRARKSVSAEDGQRLARERLRQHKLAEKETEAKRASAVATPVVKRGHKRSKDDAQAIARERVRQRNLAALAKNKANAERRMARTKYLNSLPYSKLTSAKSPSLRTKKHLGPKVYSASGGRHSLDPNPITRAYGSPTHGDGPQEGAHASKPTLTVPKAPKLSTSAKYGEKKTPTLSKSKTKEALRALGRSGRPTVPKGPRLSTSAKYGEKVTPTVGGYERGKGAHGEGSHDDGSHEDHHVTKPVPFHFSKSKHGSAETARVRQEPTLAEQMNDFMRNGLRDSKPVTSRRELKPTIPMSPKFTKITRRELPKSTAEREKAEMDYYKSHPFKAAPMPNISQVSHLQVQGTKAERTLTKPIGPHLHTKERVVYHKPPVGSPNKKLSRDEIELQKQFHARPMPDLSAPSQPVKPRGSIERKPTQPQPFHFASRAQKARRTVPKEDETKNQFKARPLPLTTFTPPSISPSRHNTSGNSPPRSRIETTPPKFATDARAEQRAESAEKHMKHADKAKRRKERQRMQLQRLKHQAAMAEATEPPTYTTPEPFHLTSERRHEQSQRKMEEERRRIETDEEKAHEFKAMPYVPSPKPSVKKYSFKLTKPRPFHLMSDARHQKSERKRKKELEKEERRQKEARTIKANPVPISTYMYKLPSNPSPKKKLVEPESPELATSSRAKSRRQYDEKAEAERLEKQRMEQEMEEKRRKEEEEELKELRRLPASEGGLMHVARPIGV